MAKTDPIARAAEVSAAAALKRAVAADVAEATIREANVEPLEEFPGTQGTWRCLCLTCLHEIDVWYSSVVYAGNGACDYCSGSRETPDARTELLALCLEALVPYPGSSEKWRSRCTAWKKIFDPTLCNARKTKFPCRCCAQRATDPDVAVEILKCTATIDETRARRRSRDLRWHPAVPPRIPLQPVTPRVNAPISARSNETGQHSSGDLDCWQRRPPDRVRSREATADGRLVARE